MRILSLHCDYIFFKPVKQAISKAERVSEEEKSGVRVEEALVVFTTVEKRDEESPELIAENACNSIIDIASQVKAKKVVLYPYAHLSTELASPEVALTLLKLIEQKLREGGLEVYRAKFGWYKSFELRCKGHPLAELSRVIKAEKREAKREKEAMSRFIVVTPEGNEEEVSENSIDASKILQADEALREFVYNELIGHKAREEPAHIKLMRKLELVDYELASDIGHFKFFPKGTLLKELLEEYATKIAVGELGCMKIETPLMYRLDEQDIAEQVKRFVERGYRLKADNKELVIRFAGDFGLFKMMQNTTMTYRHLPLRVYELSKSFRLEKRGECVGLRRLRAFTMPDIHCFCRNLEEGMNEYKELFKYYTQLANSMHIDYVVVFRVVESFYKEHKDWFLNLLNIVRKNALIELLPKMKHYWVVKHEFQFIDASGGSAQLCTVQLDVEDSERYGIYYIDSDGSKKGCIIIHSSMGSIERWMYALLEQAAKNLKKGEKPALPLWLSPIQVRIIPVSSDELEYSKHVLDELHKKCIRADLDEREYTLSRKIREAEAEWIPYIVVIGKSEKERGVLSVRARDGWKGEMKLSEFIELIEKATEGKPKLTLPMPKFLSRRPKFV